MLRCSWERAVSEERGDRELGEAWLQLTDGLLAGVGHTLNNRVAALSAVGQVLASTTTGPLSDALASESSRLQRAVQLLKLLVRRWEEEPEPLQVEEALGGAAELLSHHPELRSAAVQIDVDAGVGPIWAERSSLTHVFCLLLGGALAAAEAAGEGEVRVRCSGSDAEVRVEIPYPTRAPEGGEGSTGSPGHLRIDPQVARGLLERAGGALSLEDGGAAAAIVVRLPTLMEVRRRERAG